MQQCKNLNTRPNSNTLIMKLLKTAVVLGIIPKTTHVFSNFIILSWGQMKVSLEHIYHRLFKFK